jgi:glycosyltransferase involved in cell wall biosynthesis
MGVGYRLLALTAVRNEMRHLPDFVANVGRQVDGIVALDDGSTDGSAEFLGRCDEVVELIRVPPERPAWDEVANHRTLLETALRLRAEWVLCLDADDRLEREFRVRCERELRRAEKRGYEAYSLPLRELWGSDRTYRIDGVWGKKRRARLFRPRPDPELDTQPLHAIKAPLQGRRKGKFRRGKGKFPRADLEVYHLGMIRSEDRLARRLRYEALDPEARYQPGLGYSYLTDERGIRLRPVPRERDFIG